ncbi:hypothetical protein ILUMI_27340 [Ignelater luminosus]|uniref:Beta-defensin n=1 Tax=Ignelater luminosus TaxID=2038154 RepID=A0A8K0C6Q6_IGNLU|nr:hypothetical protein ILUMI_27340 [Ignelater luminosus]
MKVILTVALCLALFIVGSSAQGAENEPCQWGGINIALTVCKAECKISQNPLGTCAEGLNCCAFARNEK